MNDLEKAYSGANTQQLDSGDNSQAASHHASNPREQSRLSIQILDQAQPQPQSQAERQPPKNDSQPHAYIYDQEQHRHNQSLDSDPRMQQYESQFEHIQREINQTDGPRDSTVVVDYSRLKQELDLRHDDYTDQLLNANSSWGPSSG